MRVIKILKYGSKSIQIQYTDTNEITVLSYTALLNKINSNEVMVQNILTVKCIHKDRDARGQIVRYFIVSQDGKKRYVSPIDLKNAIRSIKVQCINLTLTSDNRLIDKANLKPQKQMIAQWGDNTTKVKDCELSVAVLDTIRDTINALNLNNVMIAFKCNNISDKVLNSAKLIPGTDVKMIVTQQGKANIVGIFPSVKNAKLVLPSDCKQLFMSFKIAYNFQYLLLDGLDWAKVEKAEQMFMTTNAHRIKISNSTAPNLTNMYGMFSNSSIESIDLSTFKVPKLERTTSMFSGILTLKELNLTGLNFKSVKYVGRMFNLIEDKSERDSIRKHLISLGWGGYADGRKEDLFCNYLSTLRKRKKRSNDIIIDIDYYYALAKYYGYGNEALQLRLR